jgi:hypothetical protein
MTSRSSNLSLVTDQQKPLNAGKLCLSKENESGEIVDLRLSICWGIHSLIAIQGCRFAFSRRISTITMMTKTTPTGVQE